MDSNGPRSELPSKNCEAPPQAECSVSESGTPPAASVEGCLPPGDASAARRAGHGLAIGERGYYVGRVDGNLYWVTDGTYQAAFLTTRDGVVLFDAPPTIGHNIQRAVNEITAPSGVSNKVTHLVYSHHHADHAGASLLFGRSAVRIGHEETRKLLLRDDDPARPAPEETFQDRYTLEIGGNHIDLAWHGCNHSPDNIFIHLPDHATLMLVDIVSPGWAPVCRRKLADDVPGYIEAADTALTYPWKHFIGGHMDRLGTRDDVATHRQYIADIADNAMRALDAVDPAPYLAQHGAGTWAAMSDFLDAATANAAVPVIERYTGVLVGADVFTDDITFHILQSIRLDSGYGSPLHP